MQRTWNPTAQWDPDVEKYLEAAFGRERLQRISAAIVRPPLATCLRVNTMKTTPEDVLRRLPDALSADDREMLEKSGKMPYIHPQIPFAIMVPGSGPHQVDYSDCNGLEVIVGRKAGESMLRGSNAYAPGILACTTGILEGDTVAVSIGVELPGTALFGVTRGTVLPQDPPLDDPRFPDRANLFIGVGRAEVSRSGMNPSGSGLVLTLKQRVFEQVALGDVLKGEIMLQNLPSMTAAVVLSPKKGCRVLDMCAAPGGKSTAMAQIMQDQGEVIALDRSHNKASNVTTLASELGLTCVKAYKQDATKAIYDEERARLKKERRVELNDKEKARLARIAAMKAQLGLTYDGPPKADVCDGFEPESFDYVLLDAPCSALGLRPRLLLPQNLDELYKTARYQRMLMDVAVRLLKPGGYMVFSTCTINPGENEANVRYLLDKFPFMKLAPQEPRLGGPGLTGQIPSSSRNGGIETLLTEEEAELVQRFDPSSELDTTGFFIAKFQKVASSESGSHSDENGNGAAATVNGN